MVSHGDSECGQDQVASWCAEPIAGATARRIAVAALACLACALAAATNASAAVKTEEVTFEGVAPGVRVEKQYESKGVLFEAAAVSDGFTLGEPVENGVVSPSADCLGPITHESSATHSPSIFAGNDCGGSEFPPAGTFGILTSFAKEVNAYVGDVNSQPVSFRLDAYDSEHNLVGHSEVTSLSKSIDTPIGVVAPSYEIAYFALYRTNPAHLESETVGFDDLSFKVGEAPPEITLAANAGGAIAQGASIKHTVTVLRDNGSEGDVALKATGLPAGVTATFQPEVLTGTQSPSTLTLTAENSALLAFAHATIEAVPETIKAGAHVHTVPLDVQVVAPFNVYTGLASSVPAFTNVALPPCSSASVAVRTILEPGFPGPVDLSISNPAAGADLPVTVLEHTVLEPSDFDIAGVNEQRLRITRNGNGPATGTTDVRVVGTSGAFSEPPANVIVERVAPTISSITPLRAHTPIALKGGSEVTMHGTGFCPGATVRFGNSAAVVPASTVNTSGTELKATVPRLATSGMPVLSSGGASANGPSPLTIESYRNVDGYQFHNYEPYVTFSQLTEAFGPEQTEIKIDLCWPLGCDVSLPSPIALIVQAIADNGLNSGACFGISLSSQRLLEGYKQLNAFPPTNATTIFGLSAQNEPSASLTNFINARHVSQLSTEFLSHFFGTETEQGASGGVAMSKKVFEEIQSAFAAGEYPLVALEEGGRGHVVIAYDLEGSPGDYYIDVYDSNDPFGQGGSEEGEENAAHHEGNVLSSRVHVGSDGEWELPSTGIKGGVTGLVVTDPGTFPTRPSMIGGPGPVGILFSSNTPTGAGSGPAASTVTQLEDGSGHKLLAAGGAPNPDTATRPEATQFGPLVGARAHAAAAGAVASQTYVVSSKESSVNETVTGSASGGDTHSLLGDGFAEQVSTLASSGVQDSLSFDPSSPQVSFSTAGAHKPLSLTLIKGLSKDADEVQVATTSFAGKGDQVQLSPSGSGLTFSHHGGPTTFSITLSALGPKSAPALFQSGSLHIGRGASARVSGIHWSSLAGATLRVRIGSRTLVIHNHARALRLAKVHTLSAHKAGKAGEALEIAAAVKRLPVGAKLAFSWVVRHGGRVLASHATIVSGARRSATFDFKPTARGSYSLTGSVAVIASKGLASTSAQSSRRLTFRVR